MNLNNGVTYSGLFNTVSGNFDNIASYNASFVNTHLLGTTNTDLPPLQTVTTDIASNLTTLPYTPSNLPLSIVSRDPIGNIAVNQISCNTLILLNALILHGLKITPQTDNTSVFSVTDASNTITLFNIDTTNLQISFNSNIFCPLLSASSLAQFDSNHNLISDNILPLNCSSTNM